MIVECPDLARMYGLLDGAVRLRCPTCEWEWLLDDGANLNDLLAAEIEHIKNEQRPDLRVVAP
jgi:hypothetical protein